MKYSRYAAIGLLAFFWLLAVAAAYYYVHKPLDLPLALRIAQLVFWSAAAFALTAVAGGVGRRLFGPLEMRPAARAAVAGALGLGVLALFQLLVGSIFGVIGWLNGLALLLFGWFFRRHAVSWLSDLADVAVIYRMGGRAGRAAALLSGLGFLTVFLTAAAPPLAYDSLVYHLALPQTYLAAGRIVYVEANAFWGMPQLGEMLYTWVMALTGAPESAAILGWLVGVLALVGLLGYTTQKLSPRAGWAAVAALLAGETTLRGLTWAYVDWWALLYGLCILVFLDLACSAGERPGKQFAAAGVMAGLALGTKYSAGAVLLAGLAVVLFSWRQAPIRARIRQALFFGGTASAVFLPWLLKNLLAVGNPAYPFLYSAGAMTDLRLALYTGLPAWGGWENALLLPWQAVVTGVGGGPGFGASVGPLLLAFGALFWIGRQGRPEAERRSLTTAGAFALAGLIVWAAAGRVSGLLIQTRLYFVLFPAFAFLAAAGFQNLARIEWPGVRLGRIGAALLVLALGLNVLAAGRHLAASRALPYILAQESESDYLRHNLGMYALAMEGVAALPGDSQTLFLFEPRGLACTPACDPDEFLDRWFVDARAADYDIDSVLAGWRSAGWTHVLVYQAGAEQFTGDPRFREADFQALAKLEAGLPAVVRLNGIYLLAEIP